MANDGAGITDDVTATLNDDEARQATDQPPPIPDRPADGAAKAKWVDYCVALGADRTFLTSDTEHNDGTGTIITEPALTREQLIDLADRLEG